ncbi:hypothetical protein GQ600_16978 [Phytophthora cactorum]|nr:hypothetical protein GQ600_16978 [Phytophthora cactorum]
MYMHSENIRNFAPRPVGVQGLQDAVDLCQDDNHCPTHIRKSRRNINNAQESFFNTDYYVVRDDNLHGLRSMEIGPRCTRTR